MWPRSYFSCCIFQAVLDGADSAGAATWQEDKAEPSAQPPTWTLAGRLCFHHTRSALHKYHFRCLTQKKHLQSHLQRKYMETNKPEWLCHHKPAFSSPQLLYVSSCVSITHLLNHSSSGTYFRHCFLKSIIQSWLCHEPFLFVCGNVQEENV